VPAITPVIPAGSGPGRGGTNAAALSARDDPPGTSAAGMTQADQ